MFKNETHNHPTESSPSAAPPPAWAGPSGTPSAGASYVYQSMRVTGSGDPRVPVAETLPGKLPQRKITQEAAQGFASYGNQIGLCTGQVVEYYDPGYVAKRMEIGAVVGAVPRAQVRREEPVPGDVIILVGGRTGRDGIGGATGSSKAHTERSIETCGAEVQKGDPPDGAQAAAAVPQARVLPPGEEVQRLRRRRRGGGHRRAGRGHPGGPGRGAPQVRRPQRHRAGHRREPGAHGRGGGPGGRARASWPWPPRRTWRRPWWRRSPPSPACAWPGAGAPSPTSSRAFLDTNGARPVHPGAHRRPGVRTGTRSRRRRWRRRRPRRRWLAALAGAERLQPAWPRREVRLHHRRRHGAGPVRRPAPAHPCRGHGGQVPGAGRRRPAPPAP